MVVEFTGQALALTGLVIIAGLVSRLARLENSLACVATGFLAGLAIPFLGFDTGIRAHNLQHLVFYVILPVLIFEAAWHLRPHLLKRWLLPIVLLATVGVLISFYAAAGIVYLGIGHAQGFPWTAALMTGAILAATDPIAVINQLKSQRAPEDLVTLFEGESLFNDASAIVLFTLVLAFALQPESAGETSYLGHFALVFLGGVVTGVVTGLAGTAAALLLGRPATTAIALLFTAFGTFYLAEHILHVSGIIAVMFAALVSRGFLSEVEDTVAEGLPHTWDWLGELFNNLLFVIMGLVITVGMFETHWLAMLVAIGASLVARALAVGACGLAVQARTYNIPRGWQILLVWGGLRGAIALALVLSLPVELDWWYTVQSMVFGVVLFSLLVQGTTNGRLVRRFAAS